MFNITYHLSNNLIYDSFPEDESNLRYNFYCGSVLLKTDISAISLEWEWIPILDFALSLLEIKKHLASNSSLIQEFEFTESDSKIIFVKENEALIISTSFSNESLSTSFIEFNTEVNDFYKKVILEVNDRYATAKNNSAFESLLTEAQTL